MEKKLSLLGFLAISITMTMDIYEYPVFAVSGLQLVFFVIVGGFLWFLPVALCSAEMATINNWENTGIFSWVGNILGERYGFMAVFFQWLQITIGFITMLYFIVGSISYVIDFPLLNTNPLFKFILMVLIFWIITFIQFAGVKKTEILAKLGLFVGIIIPAIILFIFITKYLLSNGPIKMDGVRLAFLPDFRIPSTIVLFITFMLSYMGVEATASYVNDLKNPNRNYPIAMIIIVIIAIVLNTVGGLSIAITVSQNKLSLNTGIIQAFEVLITNGNSQLVWIVKILACMLILGVVGEISGWIIGPIRGMYASAQQGLLSPKFRKVNKNGVPITLVIVQGIIVTIYSALLTFGTGGDNFAFLVAISITVIIYLIMYLLFFISYFVLIFKRDDLKRSYHVSGKKIGKIIIASLGFVTTIFSFIISFIPPAQLNNSESLIYTLFLILSIIVSIMIPVIIYHNHDKSLHKTLKKPKLIKSEKVNKFVKVRGRGEHLILPEEEDVI